MQAASASGYNEQNDFPDKTNMTQVLNPKRGYTGVIDEVRLLDFIQLSCLSKMSHSVLVESRHGKGDILVDSGSVIHAEADGLEGEGAFCEMLSWDGGRFQIGALPEERTASINRSWEYLLIEAIRYGNERAASTGAKGKCDSHSNGRGFSGIIEAIVLTDLVQLACMTRMDRVFVLESAGSVGKVYVRGGQVCHAEAGGLTGEDAFCELLKAEGGRFETLPYDGSIEPTIMKPWEYLLIDAVRFLDEQSGIPDDEEDEAGQDGEGSEEKNESLVQRLQRLKVSEKIRIAMTGDKESRVLLIRDSNRMVQLAIINNPRITEGEVTSIAYSRNVDEEVLRRIANNREWIKLYQVRSALAKNPKTPLTISIKMVQTLPANDLKEISRSKSVPAAVANAAKRHILQKR